MALGWYHRPPARLAEVLSEVLTVRGLVQHGLGQRGLGRHRRDHGLTPGPRMTWPCCQDDGEAGAFRATARLDCGGHAAPRAPQSRGRWPPGFLSRPSGMRLGAPQRRSAKEVARSGASLRLAGRPASAPAPPSFPAAPAVGPRVPASTILRQVAPGQSGPGALQPGLDKQASPEHGRTASARWQGGEDGGNFRPWLLRKQ
jgi:hypothetical protein